MDASVKEIPSRYAVAVDEADFETVASCFTEDATYEIHVEGQGEVARLESRESIRDFNADAHAELSRRR
jgi:3-phenylpropionate/cinnamic acid dioxygenase small subunit